MAFESDPHANVYDMWDRFQAAKQHRLNVAAELMKVATPEAATLAYQLVSPYSVMTEEGQAIIATTTNPYYQQGAPGRVEKDIQQLKHKTYAYYKKLGYPDDVAQELTDEHIKKVKPEVYKYRYDIPDKEEEKKENKEQEKGKEFYPHQLVRSGGAYNYLTSPSKSWNELLYSGGQGVAVPYHRGVPIATPPMPGVSSQQYNRLLERQQQNTYWNKIAPTVNVPIKQPQTQPQVSTPTSSQIPQNQTSYWQQVALNRPQPGYMPHYYTFT